MHDLQNAASAITAVLKMCRAQYGDEAAFETLKLATDAVFIEQKVRMELARIESETQRDVAISA